MKQVFLYTYNSIFFLFLHEQQNGVRSSNINALCLKIDIFARYSQIIRIKYLTEFTKDE